ncbi:hypothetical protein DSECCO2_266880 [anaerobic digester metagenome]
MLGYQNELRIGIVQTTLDFHTAWKNSGLDCEHMNPYAELAVMKEIRYAFKRFYELGKEAPRIIVLPEYSIPHCGLKDLEKFSRAIDAVVIGGCDMFVDGTDVRNKAVIIIPGKWPKAEPTYTSTNVYFGKKYFASFELETFKTLGLTGVPDIHTYILDAGEYGNIGVAICADFYDLERFLIYKGKVHHLIIIAYNKDYKSFEFLAEAISRLLLCNVVICNAGYYGDSLAYSPYREEYKRTIYKAAGSHIFTSQVICLPVRELDDNQSAAHDKYQHGNTGFSAKTSFKWPPGYSKLGRE